MITLSDPHGRVSADAIFQVLCRQTGLRFLEAHYEEGPVRIGSCGAPDESASEAGGLDTIERIRVRSPGRGPIVVRFQFIHKPEHVAREDVSEHLTSIFERGEHPCTAG